MTSSGTVCNCQTVTDDFHTVRLARFATYSPVNGVPPNTFKTKLTVGFAPTINGLGGLSTYHMSEGFCRGVSFPTQSCCCCSMASFECHAPALAIRKTGTLSLSLKGITAAAQTRRGPRHSDAIRGRDETKWSRPGAVSTRSYWPENTTEKEEQGRESWEGGFDVSHA